MATQQHKLLAFSPLPILNSGIGHAAISIVESMNTDRLNARLISPSSTSTIHSHYQKNAMPSLVSRALYKFNLPHILHTLSEAYFYHQLKPNDIAYLWPGTSLTLYRKIKAKGNIIISENINCHQKISKKILDTEEQRLGFTGTHMITKKSILNETEIHRLSDFIFSPSPLVTQSLIDTNIAQEKILQSSYGLHKYQQLDTSSEFKKSERPITAIFVGRVGMRKGIHLLLDYWKSANINGTLKIIGNIEDSVRSLIANYQNVSNIQFINFLPEIEKAYKSADIFILPSLEEGSPLVTYLALGAGLPCLVSPMAGAGVITDGQEGFIIEPHDKNGWVTALQKLFTSPSLREAQSKAARASSKTFLWENVGRQRSKLLLEKLEGK